MRLASLEEPKQPRKQPITDVLMSFPFFGMSGERAKPQLERNKGFCNGFVLHGIKCTLERAKGRESVCVNCSVIVSEEVKNAPYFLILFFILLI